MPADGIGPHCRLWGGTFASAIRLTPLLYFDKIYISKPARFEIHKGGAIMKFCPFRSTADKEVECSQNCVLYKSSNEDTCQINCLAARLNALDDNLAEANRSLETIASAAINRCF